MDEGNRKGSFVSLKQSRDLEASKSNVSFIFGIKTCSFMQNTERASISFAKTLQTFQKWGWDEVVWLLLSFLPVTMGATKTWLMVKEFVILREVLKETELKTWMWICCPHLPTSSIIVVHVDTLLMCRLDVECLAQALGGTLYLGNRIMYDWTFAIYLAAQTV